MGTWGSVLKYKKLIKNNFFLFNGDTFFNYNLQKINLINFKFDINLFLTNNHNYFENKKLNGLSITKKSEVIEKKNSNYINSGMYFIKSKILKNYKTKNMSIENDVIKKKFYKKKLEELYQMIF